MNDYRYALSNLNIRDDVYEALVQDALESIAIRTKFFKKSFLFDVPKYEDNDVIKNIYYFDDMAYRAERDKYANVYGVTSETTDTGIYMKAFISVDDIIFVDSNLDTLKGNIYSAIGEDFKMIDDTTGAYIKLDLPEDSGYWKRYLCIYSYIPKIEYITDKDETFIRNALIAKLKYDAYNMFYESQDGSYIAFLERAYENEINKLIDSVKQNQVLQTKNLFKGL